MGGIFSSSGIPAETLAGWAERRLAILKEFATKPYADSVSKLSIEGDVLTIHAPQASPEDGDAEPTPYDSARSRPWNKDCRGYPEVIIKVKSADDITKAVKFAVANDIKVSVAAGAHSSKAMRDGTFVVDLEHLKDIDLNTETNVVVVGSGCLIGEIDSVLKPQALGCPWGTNPGTGISGLTLSGGGGFLSRMHGFSIDNLLALEAVLPDGKQIHATKDNEYADFIAVCKGGGGNFGIVTKFHFQTHKLPNNGNIGHYLTVYLTPTVFKQKEVLANFDAFIKGAPNTTNCAAALPCGAPVNPIHWVDLSDTVVDGMTSPPLAMQGAGKLGGLFKVANKYKVKSYHSDLQTLLVPHQQSGFWYEAIVAVKDLDEKTIDVLSRFTRSEIPNKLSSLVLFPLMGKANATGNDDVLGHRNCNYWVIVQGQWNPTDGAAGREKVKTWVHAVVAALKEIEGNVSTSHAIGAADTEDADSAEAVQKVFETSWAKVQAAKRKYDPTNLLNGNRNIVAKAD